jgi:O-antigen ligase
VAMAIPPVIALFLTGTRAAWLALVVSVFLIIFFKNRKLIPIFILLGIACFPLLPDQITKRIMTLTKLGNDSSSQYRIKIYKSVIPIIKDYWYSGLGLGNEVFANIYKKYYRFTGSGTIAHSHNLFLQIWLEMGIMGVLSFLWFIIRMFKKSIKAIFGEADKAVKNVLVAGVASIAGALLMGMTDYVWFYPRGMFIFWAVIGIILAALGMLPIHKEKQS